MRSRDFYGTGKFVVFLLLGLISLWHDGQWAALGCFLIAALQGLLQLLERRAAADLRHDYGTDA